MEPAAFQLSYLHSGLVMCIERNEKLNKEAKGNKGPSGLCCPSQLFRISFWSSSDRRFHVPQVANQNFHGLADDSSCLVCPVSRGGARSQVRQGRESTASAVVTSHKQTP